MLSLFGFVGGYCSVILFQKGHRIYGVGCFILTVIVVLAVGISSK